MLTTLLNTVTRIPPDPYRVRSTMSPIATTSAGNMHYPAISVVIPTHNRANLILQALNSLLIQTFRAFETIVVDDGSTDDTRSVVAQHPLPVRYLYTQHAGVAVARNVGMRAANGRFIAYLDSDDLYYPHKLELQADWLDRHPEIGMVYTDFSAFSDDGYWDERHLVTYHESAYRHGRNRYDRLFSAREPLMLANSGPSLRQLSGCGAYSDIAYSGSIYGAYLKDTIVFTNSMMFRRGLLDSVGLQSKRFGHFHDLEFALRLCKAAPVSFLDTPTYKLRYHPDQLTSAVGPRSALVALRKQQDLLRVLRVHGERQPEYYRANKAAVDAALGRRAQAVAVPLMAYEGRTRHQVLSYPRRARVYLRFATRHGRRFPVLELLTYAPEFVRRVYFALSDRFPRHSRSVE